jgi:hypothetical protein
MSANDKSAAYWLDKAIQFEEDGHEKRAQMALNAAVKRDEDEHKVDDGPPTLPRN